MRPNSKVLEGLARKPGLDPVDGKQRQKVYKHSRYDLFCSLER